MGNQIGPVQISGKFGDIQFYIGASGKGHVRRATRLSREKIKQGSNYALTRKNNDEFTGSAYSARSLRLCMGERIKQFADRDLTSRLVSVTYSVIAQGPGMAGKRSFEVGPNTDAFKRLEADSRYPLNSRFQGGFTVTTNTDRNTAILDVPAFNVDNFLTRPQGATHFRLLLVAGVLSDYTYAGGKEAYKPVNPTMNGISATVMSATLPAVNAVNSPLTLMAAVPGAPVLPATACLVVSVGIEFLRVINTYEEVMASGNVMRVVEVF